MGHTHKNLQKHVKWGYRTKTMLDKFPQNSEAWCEAVFSHYIWSSCWSVCHNLSSILQATGITSNAHVPNNIATIFTHTSTRSPAERSMLLLSAVFHVISALLDKNAGYDSIDGKKLCNKIHLCRPAGGPWWGLNPPPLDISIIDVL